MPWRLPDLDTLPKSPPPQVVEKAVEGETAPLAAIPAPTAPVSGWRRFLPQTKSRRAYETGLRAMDAKNWQAAAQSFEQVVAQSEQKGVL